MHAHTCTHTSTHTCTQACTQARTHMHSSTYTRCTPCTLTPCTHAHTHTHTHEISEQFLMYHNLTICLLVLLETQISLETFGVLRKNGAFSWDVVGPSLDIQEIVGTGFKHFIKGVSPKIFLLKSCKIV